MCYKTKAEQEFEKMAEREQKVLQYGEQLRLRVELNGFAHPDLPVATSEEPGIIQPMRWGLIPFWVKTEHEANIISNKTLNARAETIFTKPSFRSISKRRCLIYVSSFFEWQHAGKKKIQYEIKVKGEDYFALGGLYDEWVNPITGEIIKGFSIITVEANELMAEIHNEKKRMPLILEGEAKKQWLEADISKEQIAGLITQFPSDKMEAMPYEEHKKLSLF